MGVTRQALAGSGRRPGVRRVVELMRIELTTWRWPGAVAGLLCGLLRMGCVASELGAGGRGGICNLHIECAHASRTPA